MSLRNRVLANNEDFIANDEAAEITEMRKIAINRRAREIWEHDSTREKVDLYNRAVEELATKSQDELDNPDEFTQRLLERTKSGPPMTKARAVELATMEVDRQSKVARGA